MDADALAHIADELRRRVRDEVDPEVNGRWLLEQAPDPADWFRLAFVQAAATPVQTGFLRLTSWTRPASDPRHIDEIAVERACKGDRVSLTRAERHAVVDKLTQRGLSAAEIEERIGLSARGAQRWRVATRRSA